MIYKRSAKIMRIREHVADKVKEDKKHLKSEKKNRVVPNLNLLLNNYHHLIFSHILKVNSLK
ncbi:hypothetical protein EG340_04055 [Chryseobacterium indoltheticum]|uniref:Uncharacterized protein n=1 Tax=Chryseobacterium indoltheticum TaxID=254 RepID=A0A381FHR8_9FLAO|nr:hypothetical protein EG340_04055 [Chryseobacterium indoltheticum]SUX46008.1 Uncharacterised protein [Chryseobacterium indoltheticum]